MIIVKKENRNKRLTMTATHCVTVAKPATCIERYVSDFPSRHTYYACTVAINVQGNKKYKIAT